MDIAEKLVDLLIKNSYTITTLESCTGGMISARIVDVAGASQVLNESHVTYANEAKIKYLGVKMSTLESYGAVSEQTVSEMLRGGLKLANANVALAVSGLAGPGGATDTKPVGLVYVGCMVEDKKVVEEHIFKGDRTSIREQTTKRAIELAIEMLEKRN